jgi:dephospho-CoA kinase
MSDSSEHRPAQRPLLVALTGGIASGKTAASDRLAQLGATVIDTDVIARQVVEPGTRGLAKLVEAFGDEVVDDSGELDRKALRHRIFEDPQERQRLDELLHPLIEKAAREQIAAAGNVPYVVVVVPLLIETGVFGDADRVVVVDVPQDIQVRRLMARDGIEAEQVKRILDAQASREQRLARADHVIDNSGPLAELESQVDRLHRYWRNERPG